MSREFSDLVKAVGDCKSKQEEDRIILREVALLRIRLSERDSAARMKELCVRMMYCEMLGHPVEFGYIHAVNLTQRTNLMEKRTGYLAASLFLDSKSELLILLVNTLQRDLKSQNPWEVCAALSAMTRLIGAETVPAVLKQVIDLLGHANDQVRKKATMALHRFLQTCPLAVQDQLDLFKRALCDRDPSVMSASLCAIHDLAKQDPATYQNLVPSLVIILKQVRGALRFPLEVDRGAQRHRRGAASRPWVPCSGDARPAGSHAARDGAQVAEHRLSREFDYHRMPAPWIQIKLLKILAALGHANQRASEEMYEVLQDVMRRAAELGTSIGYAVTYECVRTVTRIYPQARPRPHGRVAERRRGGTGRSGEGVG